MVAELDGKIRADRTQWHAAGKQPGPHLAKELDRAQALLEQLIRDVAVAEQSAQTAKDRLTPQLDAHTQGLRMSRAYRSATEHS
jgi:hypothetical protein